MGTEEKQWIVCSTKQPTYINLDLSLHNNKLLPHMQLLYGIIYVKDRLPAPLYNCGVMFYESGFI